MDVSGNCVKAVGDPRLCASARRADRLFDGVVKCVRTGAVKDCLRRCLRRCRGEGCEEVCLGVLKAAAGVVVAEDIAERAEALAPILRLDPVGAVARVFDAELDKAKGRDCPEKEVMAWILAVAAVELYKRFKEAARSRAQDLLLLAAPALGEAHRCVGDGVFEYLDSVRPLVGEEAVERIVAAMEEGSVVVGNVEIKFRPVKTGQ
jgi:hypothetical protein